MHFYRRKISGIFTESYANAVYEVCLEVNNRLRGPGLGKLGNTASTVVKIWGIFAEVVQGQDAPAFSSTVRPANEVFGCDWAQYLERCGLGQSPELLSPSTNSENSNRTVHDAYARGRPIPIFLPTRSGCLRRAL